MSLNIGLVDLFTILMQKYRIFSWEYFAFSAIIPHIVNMSDVTKIQE